MNGLILFLGFIGCICIAFITFTVVAGGDYDEDDYEDMISDYNTWMSDDEEEE